MIKNTEKSKIPKLRFPEFEGKWGMGELDDFSVIRTGPFGSLLHEEDYVEKGTPIITVEHLSELGIVHRNLPRVSPEDKKRLKSYILEENDIVFSRVGSVDRNSMVSEKENGWLFSGRLLRIRCKETKLFAKYLSYHFQEELTKHRIRSVAVGQTMPSLNTAILKSFHVIFPNTLPEQKKIASFLSSVDKKIQRLTRKKELLEKYKKGVMQKIFSQEIRFKDENGKDYPEWVEKRLGEILTFLSTNSFSRNDLNYENGKIKNIHYGDIHTTFKMGFDSTKENVPYINATINLTRIIEDQFCQVGDIVIADASEDYEDIGKAIEILNTDGEKILAGLHTFLGRDLTGQTVNGYKGYLFQSKSIRDQIKKMAQGISVLGISKKNIAKIEFGLPCVEEQQKIATFLSAIDKKIESIQNQLTKTQAFKKGLLQQMFV